LSDELLTACHFVFQAPLLSALDLIDRKCVTLLTSPSGRAIFQVIGSSGLPYTCLRGVNYCSCLAYRFSVLQKCDYVMCKHALSVVLSEAMSCYLEQNVTDEEISRLLNDIE